MMNRSYCPMDKSTRPGGPTGGCRCGGGTNRARTAPVSNRNGSCGCARAYDNTQTDVRRGARENLCGHNANRYPRANMGNRPCSNTACNTCSNTCTKLMEQIRAVDFALYETVLYLDVYPHSCDALETYHKLKSQSEALRREFEETCGPLSAFGNQSKTSWDWTGKPFPWEYDAD